MKTTDSRDPLDRKIDQLLASQPVQAPSDFAKRTLTEIDEQQAEDPTSRLAPILRFVLPIAAALALAFVIYSQNGPSPADAPVQIAEDSTTQAAPANKHTTYAENDSSSLADEALTDYEIQELLFLQEGLAGFAQIESGELNSGDLLNTLDTLYSI